MAVAPLWSPHTSGLAAFHTTETSWSPCDRTTCACSSQAGSAREGLSDMDK
jgi:hypothetical protein